jgi:uncharacterized protein (UPF0261 family)
VATAGVNLSLMNLDTPQAITALGTVGANLLQIAGQVTFFVNQEGLIELAPPGEVELDGVGLQEALAALLERSYDDSQLKLYLRGREARLHNAQKAGRVALAKDGG